MVLLQGSSGWRFLMSEPRAAAPSTPAGGERPCETRSEPRKTERFGEGRDLCMSSYLRIQFLEVRTKS